MRCAASDFNKSRMVSLSKSSSKLEEKIEKPSQLKLDKIQRESHGVSCVRDEDRYIQPLGVANSIPCDRDCEADKLSSCDTSSSDRVGNPQKAIAPQFQWPEQKGRNILSHSDYVWFPFPENRAYEVANSKLISREMANPGVLSDGLQALDLVNEPVQYCRTPGIYTVYDYQKRVPLGPLDLLQTLSSWIYRRMFGNRKTYRKPLSIPNILSRANSRCEKHILGPKSDVKTKISKQLNIPSVKLRGGGPSQHGRSRYNDSRSVHGQRPRAPNSPTPLGSGDLSDSFDLRWLSGGNTKLSSAGHSQPQDRRSSILGDNTDSGQENNPPDSIVEDNLNAGQNTETETSRAPRDYFLENPGPSYGKRAPLQNLRVGAPSPSPVPQPQARPDFFCHPCPIFPDEIHHWCHTHMQTGICESLNIVATASDEAFFASLANSPIRDQYDRLPQHHWQLLNNTQDEEDSSSHGGDKGLGRSLRQDSNTEESEPHVRDYDAADVEDMNEQQKNARRGNQEIQMLHQHLALSRYTHENAAGLTTADGVAGDAAGQSTSQQVNQTRASPGQWDQDTRLAALLRRVDDMLELARVVEEQSQRVSLQNAQRAHLDETIGHGYRFARDLRNRLAQTQDAEESIDEDILIDGIETNNSIIDALRGLQILYRNSLDREETSPDHNPNGAKKDNYSVAARNDEGDDEDDEEGDDDNAALQLQNETSLMLTTTTTRNPKVSVPSQKSKIPRLLTELHAIGDRPLSPRSGTRNQRRKQQKQKQNNGRHVNSKIANKVEPDAEDTSTYASPPPAKRTRTDPSSDSTPKRDSQNKGGQARRQTYRIRDSSVSPNTIIIQPITSSSNSENEDQQDTLHPVAGKAGSNVKPKATSKRAGMLGRVAKQTKPAPTTGRRTKEKTKMKTSSKSAGFTKKGAAGRTLGHTQSPKPKHVPNLLNTDDEDGDEDEDDSSEV